MKKLFPFFILLCLLLTARTPAFTQQTPAPDTVATADSATKPKLRPYHDPKKAIRLSLIFPGLGQVYNKKYWKLPIVYGAMGISAGVFFYNLKSYKDTRFAFQAKYKASRSGATAADSVDYFKIRSPLEKYSLETLKYYRDSFRKDIDYSVVVFILLWGLNVVDAAVDAHLKSFDVSPDLSLKIKPGKSQMAGTTGLSLVLAIR